MKNYYSWKKQIVSNWGKLHVNPTIVTAGIFGGTVAFFWKIVSWMVLPWHTMLMHSFTDSNAVNDVIRDNAPQSGIYFSEQGPLIFAMVDLQGAPINIMTFVVSLALQILGACFIAWLVLQSRRTKYWQRIRLITGVAFLIAVLAYLPEWNWIRFAGGYTVLRVADILITWFLAGLVIAKVVRKHSLFE